MVVATRQLSMIRRSHVELPDRRNRRCTGNRVEGRCRYAALVLLATVALAGVANATAARVVVGSKAFTESTILGEILAQAIAEQTDAVVERRANLAGTNVCFNALRGGEIDIYPEYTGTGLRNILGDETPGLSPAATFARVAREFSRRYDLEWMAPLGFDNTYVLLMRSDTAERLSIRTISDLARHPMRYGVSHEFLRRADGMPGLRLAYPLQESDTIGLSHDLAYQGLEQGSIDVTDGYSTDAKILSYELSALIDDRGFFPPYEAAPLMRRDLRERVPGIDAALRLLAGRLDASAMRRLNVQVEDQRRDVADVAADFLAELGIGDTTATAGSRAPGFLALLYQRRWLTLRLTLRHLLPTGGAVFLACLVGVPLGIVASRRPAFARIALGVAGVMQTVPSIALLAFMLPLFGIGVAPALVALFLYALLPVLRNTVTGLRSIEDRVLDVGRGLGMTDTQILRQIELPLAAPVLMAGVRTATVISVGTATLAAFIGAGGLGDPIVTGLSTTDNALVLCGALPAAALAIALDYLLAIIEHATTPRGLREG